MANIFLALPTTAADGPGTAVDVSVFGATKTVVCSGSWTLEPTINIEINNAADPTDGSWQSIATFQGAGGTTLLVAARWARASIINFRGGQAPVIGIGSTDDGTDFATLVAPAGNGAGAAVAASSLPTFKTVQVSGPFRGSVAIEISLDGGATWGVQMSFSQPGFQSAAFVADFMRVSRNGVPTTAPGLPEVNLGACTVGGGGAGAGADDLTLTNDQGSTVVAGAPVYVSSAGNFRKANADDIATGRVIGLTVTDIVAGASGKVRPGGSLELTTGQWDAVAGTTGGLSYNIPYYLSAATAGTMTPTPPNVSGQVVEQLIVAVSPTIAVIKIADPEVLGSGSNEVYLTNDNAGTMLICQPVYSSSAGGCDLARANNSGKGVVIGLVADATIAHLARGKIVTGGLMIATTAQWDAVCGTSGGLTFNTTYYLSWTVAGQLTSTPPVSPTNDGNQVVVVIDAISATEATISIQPPVLL